MTASVPSKSIKIKLLHNTLLLLVGAFCLILALVIGLNLYQSQQNLKQSQAKLYQHLSEKAEMLILSNQFALKGMVEDNAIGNVKDFVQQTVAKDSAIAYGYFLDENQEFWVKSDPKGLSKLIPTAHAEKISNTREIAQFNHTLENGMEILEFTAPIISNEELLGFIVYGYTTSKLNSDLSELKKQASANALISIIIILGIVFGTLMVTYTITKKQAETITEPLASLARSAKTIAIGNYELSIKAETDDEIGELARNFESMRKTVKLYTTKLRQAIQDKSNQIDDILANIEEGIFTIDLEGIIYGQHSNSILKILKVDNLEGIPLTNLMTLSDDTIDFFNDWLRLVSKKYNKMRWNKIVQLCPLLEVERIHEGEIQTLKVNFQKVYNQKDELEKLMVQMVDVTEAKALEQKVKEERIEHEHQLRLVLGIAENPPETIDLFIEDSFNRIKEIQASVNNLRSEEIKWSGSILNLWMENIHTIKGNAGSLGFEKLNQLCHQTENTLLTPEIISGSKPLNEDFLGKIKLIHDLIEEIDQKDKLLHGHSDQKELRISEQYFKDIVQELSMVEPIAPDLLRKFETLHWKNVQELTDKYQRIVTKANIPSNQKVQFLLNDYNLNLPPDFFKKIDAAIIHLVRNSISHGFRSTDLVNSPTVKFSIKLQNEVMIKISDNGTGLDSKKIYQRALELEIIQPSQEISEQEKLQLIFNPNFSTNDKVTLLSGRGVGMSMIKRTVNELGGTIELNTAPNEGVTFTLKLPKEQFDL